MGEWNSVFAVPCSVVDRYIKLASANSLKLLLYMLRHGGEVLSEEKLKNDLGFTKAGELEDAALFWVQRGIIRYENNAGKMQLASATERQISDLPAAPLPKTEQPKPTVQVAKPAVVTSGEVAGIIKSDDGVRMLFAEAEKLYGRTLRQREISLVASLTEHYGLNAGVAVMLLKFCFKIGKTTPAYINSVAANWAEEGIDTIDLANRKILALEKRFEFAENLRREMGMEANFTPKTLEDIRVWNEEWGFNEEMIMLAYNKTLDSIGYWKSSYANTILFNWKNAGLTTVEAVKASDEVREKQKTGKSAKYHSSPKDSNSSFNIDEVMANVIKDLQKG